MSYLIGLTLALAVGAGARYFGLDKDRAFYSLILAVVGSYDIAFAISSGDTSAILFEVAVEALLVIVMVVGFRTSLWWIVGGLAAHGLLDAVHGELVINRGIPTWWPAFCATFDIVAAAVLAKQLALPTRQSVSRPAVWGILGVAAIVTLLGAFTPGVLMAQERARPAVSVTLINTRPTGALDDNIGLGYGASASLLLPITRSGSLSFRADIAGAEYGSDERRSQFSESVGGRVDVDVRTVNTIVPASIGLQWGIVAGPFRPYLNTGIGVQVFYTESRVEPSSGGYTIASTVNQSDIALSWTFGGGVTVPVSRRVQVDGGVQMSRGGRAEYLAPGSITDLPGGAISITPMESTTNLLTLRLGARIGL